MIFHCDWLIDKLRSFLILYNNLFMYGTHDFLIWNFKGYFTKLLSCMIFQSLMIDHNLICVLVCWWGWFLWLACHGVSMWCMDMHHWYIWTMEDQRSLPNRIQHAQLVLWRDSNTKTYILWKITMWLGKGGGGVGGWRVEWSCSMDM